MKSMKLKKCSRGYHLKQVWVGFESDAFGFNGVTSGAMFINEKWRKQQILELEVFSKRLELVLDQIKAHLEELGLWVGYEFRLLMPRHEEKGLHTVVNSGYGTHENTELKQTQQVMASTWILRAIPFNLNWKKRSSAQVETSVVQSQILGPGNKALNANASKQQESQVSAAAISPADLYRFVFVGIEEEKAEDTSY
ncbi:unnamed protein product [Fraxinus pennsylvanica]|uniref:Uncharacterized protein n=1 Tax=Fraxinus pennsylvanica TaxID=56036 RepID=A0AAD2A7S5_9LAMI|nr:unnamed protein product [Fraxinus pennsylvanica]